jgi:Ca2+:H+ antiporter
LFTWSITSDYVCTPLKPSLRTGHRPVLAHYSSRAMRPVYFLGVFIPAAIALELAHADPVLIFGAAALGVIPCAAVMGEATEAIAARSGPGIGGFLNVTFGNAPELIIAFFALLEGLQEVVKASIVGSIIGNILLVMGAAMLVGGWSRDKQTFSRTAANAQSGMLLLALAALILPAIFQLVHGGGLPGVNEDRVDFGSDLEKLSLGVALVLLASYAAGLWFSLRTHRAVFNPFSGESEEEAHHWPVKRAAIFLAVSAVAVGVMSEILVGSISEASDDIGLSEFFVGVFIVAIVGNAAEHWVAVLVAAKDKMDLAVNIAIGSSAQIALFVAPVLVLASFVVGPDPMALVFNGYELGALLFAVLIANLVTQEGESNWFEGIQLLALYAVLGLVFYFA